MSVGELVVTVLSASVLLGTAVTLLLVAKNPARSADLRYAIFRARRVALILAVGLHLLAVVGAAILGVGFIVIGRSIGWAFAVLAGVPLMLLAYFYYIAKLPLEITTDTDAD